MQLFVHMKEKETRQWHLDIALIFTQKSIEKSMLSFIQFTHRIFVLVYNHFSSEMLQLYTLTLRGGEIRAFINSPKAFGEF